MVNKMNKCKSCGFENNEGANICAQCGAELDKDDNKGVGIKHRFEYILKTPQMLKALIITIFIAILAIIFFALQVRAFVFDKAILLAEVILLVFFSLVFIISLILLIVRICLKKKERSSKNE